jgi:hypothetical protein
MLGGGLPTSEAACSRMGVMADSCKAREPLELLPDERLPRTTSMGASGRWWLKLTTAPGEE